MAVRLGTIGLAGLLLSGSIAHAYSVLTHEAIIDSAWETHLKPALLKRFPNSTPEALLEAHAYAYGGCIIQDMGYYPFGSKFFSDLVHYVRTGDFVLHLMRDAQDLDEYAFALGALAHYNADTEGHSVAVNPSVGLEYPKLRREYGPIVTYEDDPVAHIRVEFGFDVVQVAHGSYAPQAYHDFIGFQVAKPVLERAFRDTYSLEMKDVFGSLDLALNTYRHAVGTIIPEMTKIAWNMNKDELVKAHPGLIRRKFVYNVSRASYSRDWPGDYRKPGIGARVLAFFIRILPKIGPLKALKFKPPTPETEKKFEASFNRALDQYRAMLSGDLTHLRLVNRNLDTGQPTRPTAYHLADKTFAKLAIKLAGQSTVQIDPQLRDDIDAYFGDLSLPFKLKKSQKEWQDTLAAVSKFRSGT
jgi:hypothetical protein